MAFCFKVSHCKYPCSDCFGQSGCSRQKTKTTWLGLVKDRRLGQTENDLEGPCSTAVGAAVCIDSVSGMAITNSLATVWSISIFDQENPIPNPVHSLLFNLGVYHAPSSPSLLPPLARFIFLLQSRISAVDPVVPMLPGDSDREKKHNASSCFANPLSLCMSRKIPAGWTNLKHGESKVLKGIGLYTWIVSFFCSHYTVQSVFTSE